MPAKLGVIHLKMNLPDKLQSFRAAHAIAEAGAILSVTDGELPRYEWINRYFHVPYAQDECAPVISVTVSHSIPYVRLGQLQRPLLFAHEMLDKYRAVWARERHVRFWFSGHRTSGRRESLERWILSAMRRVSESRERTLTDVNIGFSESGRHWPGKAWDETYAATLGCTQFALCPNGNYAWTYRFFEACAAGAIPIVESYCEHYNGFVFHEFDETPGLFEWTEAAAAHNASLARARITASLDEIASAVNQELQRSTG